MYRLDDLLQIGDATILKGVSVNTLRRWEVDGKILPVRTEGGHRRYRVSDLLKVENKELRHTVLYGRAKK